jgi:hypothetical protein
VVCVAAAEFESEFESETSVVRRALACVLREAVSGAVSGAGGARVHLLLALPPESQPGALARLNALETMAAAQARSVLQCVDVIHPDDVGAFCPAGEGCAWWLQRACLEHFDGHSAQLPDGAAAAGSARALVRFFEEQGLMCAGLASPGLAGTDWADLGRARTARVKGLLASYGWVAQVLERQHEVHRAELWPRASCFQGSTAIPGSSACLHVTLGIDDSVSIRVARTITAATTATNHSATDPATDSAAAAAAADAPTLTTIASLPPDALERVLSFFSFQQNPAHALSCVRNLRYCITSCKGLACAAKNVVLRSMRVVPDTNTNRTSSSTERGSDAAKGAANTNASLASVAALGLEGVDLAQLSLAHFQTALGNLSLTLVALGVPQRLVWRAKQHKARGNRELANGNFARALGHYALVFHKCLELPDAASTRLASWQHLVPPEFDFQGCAHHDARMLFAPLDSASGSMPNAGVHHISVLEEWDARVHHGRTSRAAASLNLIVMQSLADAAFCLLKMNEPRVALLFATWARDGPQSVLWWGLKDPLVVRRPWRTGARSVDDDDVQNAEVRVSRSRSSSSDTFNKCKLQAGTMSKAHIYRTRAELRMVQALRGLGRCADAKVLCVRALNRFRGDPAAGQYFRQELKLILCAEDEKAMEGVSNA